MSTTKTSWAIETVELTRTFGQRTAVDHLSLQVARGSVFGFLGPNGAGKTTTIAMLLGLVKPTSGYARVLGHDVQQEPVAALRGVGAMIEYPAFYPYLSGYDNLLLLARADGIRNPHERIRRVLDMVDLESRARDRFSTYSQGMKQRLGIAAALLPDPQLVILDEPTNGLDPAGTVEMRSLIQSLATEGRTIFLSSHLLHEIEQTCDQVAIIKQGRLLASGKVAELLHRGQGVQVRVADNPAAAMALLAKVEWISGVQQQGDTLLIDAPTERAAEINALLTRNDLLVAEIRTREESLEAFFLEITEQG